MVARAASVSSSVPTRDPNNECQVWGANLRELGLKLSLATEQEEHEEANHGHSDAG